MHRTIIFVGLIALVAMVPASATAKVLVGISDNKPAMFGDPAFQTLGTKSARIVVPWDGLSYAVDRQNLDLWMAGARASKVKVLIAFDKSRHGKRNPTPGKLSNALKVIVKRYPGQVTWVTTWNETNINEKNKPPKRVAQWYKALRKVFPKSRIIAADVVDRPNLNSWTRRYLKELRKQKVPRPKFWGLHNYVDVNNFTDRRTKSFLKIVKGKVWLTETGGVVSRKNGSKTKFRGKGAKHASRATSYLLNKLVKRNRKIKYVFVYHWNAEQTSSKASWDSALRASNGELRPAYNVLKKYRGK